MRSSMDYNSHNQQDHSSSIGERITRDRPHDQHNHQSTNSTTTPIHYLQTLGSPNNKNYPNNQDPVAARYRECQKNHAATSGGHVLDGCGEFMPAGPDDDGAMKCAACECHRSFHRREFDGQVSVVGPKESQIMPRGNSTGSSALLLPHHQHHYHHHPHHRFQTPVMMMAFGGAESSSEDLHRDQASGRLLMAVSPSSAKKRFRTKFKQDQKEKMTEFAERIGWRMQKNDEQEVQRFCSEVGVKRQVFKVWMHNNKQIMKKKDNNSSSSNDNNNQPNVNMTIT